MNSCFLCSVQQQKNQIIWENDTLFSILDNYPVNPGHALIIPKRHVAHLQDLNEKEWCEIKNALTQITNSIIKTDLI
jgi:diadenosine tetraphosphate (Ap4A) HIT family hydrolase